MTYKVQHERAGTIIIKTRQMKNSHKASFLRDLQEKAWSDVETLNDPNDMWSMWKEMLMQAIDKHAPLKTKRVGKKSLHGLLIICAMKCIEEISQKRKQFWAVPLWLGININVPGTTQITKLRMLSVNILLTIWSPANQTLKKHGN